MTYEVAGAKMLCTVRGDCELIVLGHSQGDCLFGWDLMGYYKMDRTFYSLFIDVRPFLFRGKTELEWQRGLQGTNRMCDPFCNNPSNPIQTDSHLDDIILHFEVTLKI